MGGWDFLGAMGSRLLRSSCEWEAHTGTVEDSALDKTQLYSTPVTLACNINSPSSRWGRIWPDLDLSDSKEFVLPYDSSVSRMDRLTFDGKRYIVQDVANWDGAGVLALAQRTEGLD